MKMNWYEVKFRDKFMSVCVVNICGWNVKEAVAQAQAYQLRIGRPITEMINVKEYIR